MPVERLQVLQVGFFGSIRTRLAIWFLLVALVPFTLVLWIARDAVHDFAERTAFDRIAAVARDRARTLERAADDALRTLDVIARAPGFVRAVIAFAEEFDAPPARVGPPDEEDRKRHIAFLDGYADASTTPELLLIGRDRRILYSSVRGELVGQSLDDPAWRGGVLASTVDRVALLLQPEISPSEPPSAGRPSAIWAVGPLLDGPHPAGFVAQEFSRRTLDGVITDRWGLLETGEVIVASAVDQEERAPFLVTGPLAGDPAATMRVEVERDTPLGRRLELAKQTGEGGERSLGRTGRPVLAAWTYVPSFGWSLCIELDEAEVFAVMDDIRNRGAFLVFAVLFGALILAFVVARRFASPLRSASEAAARIAAGDLSRPVQVEGSGELRDLLVRMRQTNDDLAMLVARVQWSAGQILSASGQVSRLAGEQNELAGTFGSSTAQIAAATNQMHATSRELRTTVTSLEDVAERAGAAAGAGRTSLDRIGSSMERLDEGANEIAGRLGEIRERAAAVDEAVTVIARVANRTNLLAVNAAIEAEKAGPHGRGFHVVASEIDRLATQTAASALEIESIVASMRSAVGHGVRQVEGFERVVCEACETASGAEEEIGSILGQVEELRASFAQVALAIESQSEGISQVHAAMTQLVEGARKTSGGAAQAAESGEELARAAASLESEVANFRLG